MLMYLICIEYLGDFLERWIVVGLFFLFSVNIYNVCFWYILYEN